MMDHPTHDWTWINGQVYPGSQPVIHADDQGFMLGISLFETIAVVNGKPVNTSAHIHRLMSGLQRLETMPPSVLPDVQQILNDLFANQPGRHGVLRLTMTPGRAGRGLSATPFGEPMVVARYTELDHLSHHPVSLHIASIRKNPDSPVSYLKSTSYLDHRLALTEARKHGADDALLMTSDGLVSCSTTANVLIWDGHHLKYPDHHSAALPGTTLALLQALLTTSRRPVASRLNRLDLDVAKGVYLVNSLKGIQPVNAVGDRKYYSDVNAVYAEMTRALRRFVVAECGEHVGKDVFPWLEEG